MDFASSAAQKTKANPDFGASANLTAPVEAQPGVFAKQLLGALKMTKASDLGRSSPHAEALREARAAHEARQARNDDRSKPGRPAKAERAERPERPERPEEARFERKPSERSDEVRETKPADKSDRPAKSQKTERPKTKDDGAEPTVAAKAAEGQDDAAVVAEANEGVETEAGAATDASTETVANDQAAQGEQDAMALEVNPFQIALKAAEEAPGPLAVTLLQAANREAKGEVASEIVPFWLHLTAATKMKVDDDADSHTITMEERQPDWDNPDLLARFDRG